MNLTNILNNLPFKYIKGKIYAVGGCVRDEIRNKDPKDIDLVVTGVSQEYLIEVLKVTGKVDLVGESFAVIKYKPFNTLKEYDFDIALPRTEKKSGDAHTDFIVDAGAHISLEEDLYRRDFTMNAIALDSDGVLVDPYNGYEDIKAGVIRLVNPDAFSDDPLRMLRAIQFASRFGFRFELETLTALIENVELINSITKERVLIELEKIAFKGNCGYAGRLLENTGLYKEIFMHGQSMAGDYYFNHYNINTVGELIVYLTNAYRSADFYKVFLKGNTETTKEIKALCKLHELYNVPVNNENPLKERLIIFDAWKLCPTALNTKLFDAKARQLSVPISKYLTDKYPLSLQDLKCDGNEVMDIGFHGPAAGKAIRSVLEAVLGDKIQNTNKEIIAFLKEEVK